MSEIKSTPIENSLPAGIVTESAQSAAAGKAAEPRAEETGGGSPELVDESVLQSTLENLREISFGPRTINFSYDETVRRVVVTVRTEQGGETVRQIPAKEYLNMISKFRELFGVLLDEQA